MDRPRNTADIVGLMTFDEPLVAETIRGLVEQHLLKYDRFKQRVVQDGLLNEVWEEDPSFSLPRHVVSASLPDGNASLERFVANVATERLDPEHPLWQMHVVDLGKDGGALVMKVHHCIGDGFALVGVLLSLADEISDTAVPSAKRVPTLAALDLLDEPWKTIRDAVLDPTKAVHLAKEGAGLAWALAKMALLPADPDTVLQRPLSGRRNLAWSRGISLEQLRAGCHQLGATANEVLIAALSGALGGHLLSVGDRVDKGIRAVVPVNLRHMIPQSRTSDALGNRFGLMFAELPVHLATPDERLEAVRAHMLELKRSPQAVVAFGVLTAMGMIPKFLEQAILELFSSKGSLVVTNVPGPRESLHFGGKRIGNIMFCVPHPARLGLGVSILSYAGEIRIGVRADESVMPSPQLLVDRFHRELDRLVRA